MVKVLVIDIDQTLTENGGDYYARIREVQLQRLAEELGLPNAQAAKNALADKAWALNKNTRQLYDFEVVLHMGVTPQRWAEIRTEAADVTLLPPSPYLADRLLAASRCYRLVAASNSLTVVCQNVLKRLGVSEAFEQVLGMDSLGTHKPYSKFFTEVAKRAGVPPKECFSYGDKPYNDVVPALEAGYAGAMCVKCPCHLASLVSLLLATGFPKAS